jgi:hypothetical protein
MFKPTMPTLKSLPIAERFTLLRVNVPTLGAGLTGVGGRNEHDGDACNIGFVFNEHTKLVERPMIRSTPLRLASRLLIQTISNARKVFKCQCSIQLSCFVDQRFRDIVIQPLLEALFSAGEPSQQFSGTASALALNPTSDLAISVSNGLNLFAAPGLSSTGGGDVSPTQINSNHLWSLASRRTINLNYKVDVVLPFLGFVQGSTGQLLSPEQRNLIPADGQLEVASTRFQGDTNRLSVLQVSECPNVKANRSWPKPMYLLHCLGITNHTPNRLADVIRLQSSRLSHRTIDLVVKLGRVPAVFLLGHFQNLITSISKPLKSQVNFWPQLYRDYQLTLRRQGLSHTSIVTPPTRRAPIPPRPTEVWGFSEIN